MIESGYIAVPAESVSSSHLIRWLFVCEKDPDNCCLHVSQTSGYEFLCTEMIHGVSRVSGGTERREEISQTRADKGGYPEKGWESGRKWTFRVVVVSDGILFVFPFVAMVIEFNQLNMFI
jgi:hypothetical protein